MATVEPTPNVPAAAALGTQVSRRKALVLGGLGVAGATAAASLGQARLGRASVFVARHQRYDGDLQRTVRDGLVACGLVARRLARQTGAAETESGGTQS